LALQRPKNYTGRGRLLHAISRFEETPPVTAIELHDGEYIRLESLDIAAAEVESALLAAAPGEQEEARAADELMFTTGLAKTTAREALDRLYGKGALVRTGAGVKGDPHRYHRPPVPLAA
jgi:hypothetical protein